MTIKKNAASIIRSLRKETFINANQKWGVAMKKKEQGNGKMKID
jgi:hypothetical protein